MTRDDIIRMASEAGNSVVPQGDTRDPLDVYLHEVFVFADLIKQHLIAEGYRKCAEGQQTTHFCGQLEAAVKAEREALCQWIETVFASYERADNIVAAIRARGDKSG